MRLLLLSDANSIHTQKWALSLQKEGLNLHVFSLMKPTDESEKIYTKANIPFSSPDLGAKIKNIRKPNRSKLIYLSALPNLKELIKNYNPVLIHAHYASSYGLLAYLSKFKPFIVSLWGSDVLDFPTKNWINQLILNRIISSADQVCSTSKFMVDALNKSKYHNHFQVIPFGVDSSSFVPATQTNNEFIVGTIKSIEYYNGIDCLLDAAKIVVEDKGYTHIKFLIIGKGSYQDKMEQKCKALGLEENVQFPGFVPHDNIVDWFQKLSIFVAVSTRESFGVSILEAASCAIPAITSNVGGLPEVNANKVTGFLIPPEDPEILAKKIIDLYTDKDLRKRMGRAARERILSQFNWDKSVTKMIKIYNKLCP